MINIAKSDLFVYSSDHLDPVAAKITKDHMMLLHDDVHVHRDHHLHSQGFVYLNYLQPLIPAHRRYYEHNYKQLVEDLKQIDHTLSNITTRPKHIYDVQDLYELNHL
jgi:zinc transport system substrate-binding protein